MITIFHGLNTPASRKALTDAREKVQNPVSLNGATVTLTDLAQALSGQALFSEEKFLFIEEFYSKRKKSKETDAIVEFIAKHEKENIIYLWESKELTPSQIKSFGKSEIQKFDLPKYVFSFLDSITPKNSKAAIDFFHKTLETEDAEFIFFMVVRLARILLALSQSHSGALAIESQQKGRSYQSATASFQDDNFQIDEVKRMAPWQRGKLQKQANGFSTDFLRFFYNNLFTIEKGMKTGTLPTSLTQAIDFLLLSL